MGRTPVVTLLVVTVLVVLAGCGSVGSAETRTSGEIAGDTPLTERTGATTPPEITDETTDPASPSSTATTTPEHASAGPNGTLAVHFINVGQGSSTLIVGPSNETMLVDSGDWTDDGEHVIAYLEQLGIERLDYLVTSHADADHIGGHAAVITHFETHGEGIGAIYDPGIASSSQTYQAYLDAVEEHEVTLYETRAGDQIPFEGLQAQVLAPPAGYLADGDRNENSLAIQLGFGDSSFLLAGDGEQASEQFLLKEYDATLNATVLNAGHHGSRSSSSTDFLETVRPRLAVISSAYESQYGHPHEEVLQRLAQHSIRTYWTATHGTIRLTSNGSTLTVATQRDAPTDPLSLRNATAIQSGATDTVERRTVIDRNESMTAPVAPDGGTTSQTATPTDPPASPDQYESLSIATVHADAAGDEYDTLNDEYLIFENTGPQPLDLAGWTVTDEAGHSYTFPSGFTLEAGAQVTLHTGTGTDSASELYWGSDAPIWNNAGDTIIVRTDSGTTVIEESY